MTVSFLKFTFNMNIYRVILNDNFTQSLYTTGLSR
jgi:hypothetical protein